MWVTRAMVGEALGESDPTKVRRVRHYVMHCNALRNALCNALRNALRDAPCNALRSDPTKVRRMHGPHRT